MVKKICLVILILALATFLRIWGIDYGLPHFLVNDERALVYSALKMAELKTLIPALHPDEFDIMNPVYNFLTSYVYLIFLAPFILFKYFTGNFSNFTELGNYFILNPSSLWLISRIVTALIGSAAVYLIYLLGKKIADFWLGIIAALFLTFSFLHIQVSHFTRPWAPMVFFICLIMLLAFYIYQSPKRKYYAWMGLALGLAFGVSPAMAFLSFIFFLAHFLSGHKLRDKNLWLAMFIFLFLAGVFTLINPQRFSAPLSDGGSVFEYLRGFSRNIKALLFYEPVLSIFSLIGVLILWFKSKKFFFIFLSWPIFWISATYFLTYEEFIMPVARYLLFIIPWLIILASFAVYFLARKMPKALRVIFLIFIFAYPLAIAIQYNYLLSQKDTRILALEWIEENIPAGAKIISNWKYIDPAATKEAILFQKELDESSLRILDKTLLKLNDENYPAPAYDLLKISYIDKEKASLDLVKIVRDRQYQYFLREDYLWGKDRWLAEEEEILQKAQLIQEFRQGPAEKAEDITCNFIRPNSILFSLERPGSRIRIYELK